VSEIPYVTVLVLATLSGLTTLIGGALALTLGRSERGAVAGIGFSTGIMIIISVFDLIPETTAAAGLWRAAGATFLGLLLIAAADPLIAHFHIVKEEGVFGVKLKSAYLIAFGLILHDFPEGFAITSSGFGVLQTTTNLTRRP